MLELVLLVVGIVKAVQRPKLSTLTAQNFPDTDPALFAEWQLAQLKATDIFLCATWGAFAVRLILALTSQQIRLSFGASVALTIAILIGWIIGLITAGVYSGKATRLKEAAGINWPHKTRVLSGAELQEETQNVQARSLQAHVKVLLLVGILVLIVLMALYPILRQAP